MALPKQTEIELPLLMELDKAGGRAKPAELYPRVRQHFPQITDADMQERLDCGHIVWQNRVQWVRQRLANKGEIDGSIRGVWAITAAGRQRLRNYRRGVAPPPAPRRGRPKRVKATRAAKSVDHDTIARALDKIGQAFGFETKWKPKVNALRPDRRAFQSRRKTLDVAWGIANLTWVPIEVQVGGSVADLIYRFQQVHQWSLRLVVVTVPAFRDEIREAIHDYPFRDKVIILEPGEVLAATRSLDRLLDLRKKVFES